MDDRAPFSPDVFEDDETRAALMQAVKDLAERDRIIIALYYVPGVVHRGVEESNNPRDAEEID